ncbi:MAG: glycoside hydrolase family 3 C-terminal domain-containing protein [Spirochaetes bacterium]|nr:glycoside hydrolase family 3 C-terminal domain-containing protein [Spirochaetota bacterium]MBN2772560.1 glycoside hydrolase family 3 C-terminal domain-containing protein [Spirochaetota bacterium]
MNRQNRKSFKPLLSHTQAAQKAAEVVSRMTLEEKIEYIGGHDYFFIKGCDELNLPRLYLTDATQGIHIRENIEGQPDKSTAFPAPIALASSWNVDLAYDYAECIARECRAGGITVLLAPGMNIYRNSQNGRNFEYLGEDPFLAARFVEKYVSGIQDMGVMATLKHFVCNNSDFRRRRSNSIVSERTLFEIYLPAFKAGIDAGAMAVMTAYNQLNGEWTGQSSYVIKDLLRNRLGFKWLVMSDWWSVWDPAKAIKSGLDIDMPGHGRGGEDDFEDFGGPFLRSNAARLVSEGEVVESDIDRMVTNLLATSLAMGFDRPCFKDESLIKNRSDHVKTALQTAREGTVLLKNSNNLLPVPQNGMTVLLTGDFLTSNAFGGGAAEVEGYDVITLEAAFKQVYGDNLVCSTDPDESLIKSADVVFISAGTLDHEGWDSPFDLDKYTNDRISRISSINRNSVVIMQSGRGVNMSQWIDNIAGLLYCWYPGQTGNQAIAEIVSGRINPSGKLPITIERSFEDSPAYPYIPEGESFYTGWDVDNDLTYPINDIPYNEGVFTGYRWYEKKKIKPLFAFGFGLSYTDFKYSDIKTDKISASAGSGITVSFKITNTGDLDGSEVCQLYVRDNVSSVPRPYKELKGFSKLFVPAGESANGKIELDAGAFSYYDEAIHDWKIEPGDFTLYLCSSSEKIECETVVTLK